jgi:hypothetical protein
MIRPFLLTKNNEHRRPGGRRDDDFCFPYAAFSASFFGGKRP